MLTLRFRFGPFPQTSSRKDEVGSWPEDKGRSDIQGDTYQLAPPGNVSREDRHHLPLEGAQAGVIFGEKYGF